MDPPPSFRLTPFSGHQREKPGSKSEKLFSWIILWKMNLLRYPFHRTEGIKEEVSLRGSPSCCPSRGSPRRSWAVPKEGGKSAPQGQEAMPVEVRSALPGAQEGSGGRRRRWQSGDSTTDPLGRWTISVLIVWEKKSLKSSKNIGGGVLVAGGQGSALPIGIKTQIYSKPHMVKPPLCDL